MSFESTTDGTLFERVDRLRNSRTARAVREILLENRLAQLGLVIILITSIVAIFAPQVAPYDPTAQNVVEAQLEPPSWDHPMGTDQYGRDILSRVIFGARISLQAGVGSVSFALLFGVPLGLVSGYYKGSTR